MKRLALVSLENGGILEIFPETLGRLNLPDGAGQVSPPQAGWKGGGKLVTTQGPPRFEIVAVRDCEIPQGKRPAGEPVYRRADDGTLIEDIPLEDMPPPPPPMTRAQKIDAMCESFGFTREELAEELGIRRPKPGQEAR